MIAKSKDGKELMFMCNCGCCDGMMFSAELHGDGEGFFSMSTVSADFYTMQAGFFCRMRNKLKHIWYIIRNKEYRYCEVCFRKDDIYELKEYIDQIAESFKDINVPL